MEKESGDSPLEIYQLKVTLKGSRPPIWRRILVPGPISLVGLHGVIQSAMGWENRHLFEFEIKGLRYADNPEEAMFTYDPPEDPFLHTLDGLGLEVHNSFTYLYDFGDDWIHQVLIEAILPADASLEYPVCIKGIRACPPEDCGGIWGFESLLDILGDSSHPDYESMAEWVGPNFDPEAFDLDMVNRRMKRAYR